MCGGVFRGPKTPKQPEIKPIAPTPTDTTSADVSNIADVAADLERQRKKRGTQAPVLVPTVRPLQAGQAKRHWGDAYGYDSWRGLAPVR
ncbi:MAG: hypothetical protein ACLVLA_02795 [Acidaminococcus intestini]